MKRGCTSRILLRKMACLCYLSGMISIGRVAILGAGLLGASLARALKARKVAENISVWSRSESTRKKCADIPEVFNEVCSTASGAVSGADVSVICSPTKNIPEIAAEISSALKEGAIVTDVGSVKGAVCRKCAVALSGSKGLFIGSHPMAGSEKNGIDNSDASLFDGAACFVTPSGPSQEAGAEFLKKMWEAVGMRVSFVSPDLHDAIVARVSHLPHLLAGTLCFNASNFKDADLRNFSGPGFRDTTRVASGSPEMWDSIVSDNRAEIVSALKSYASDLDSLISCIESGDSEAVGQRLRLAKKYRDKL